MKLGLLALLLASGIGLSVTNAAATEEDPIVTIENFTFKPAALTVHLGARVRFKNGDDIPHSIVMTDGSFHSKVLDTDEESAFTFARIGDYAYFCGLHPHMQGKVTVVP